MVKICYLKQLTILFSVLIGFRQNVSFLSLEGHESHIEFRWDQTEVDTELAMLSPLPVFISSIF